MNLSDTSDVQYPLVHGLRTSIPMRSSQITVSCRIPSNLYNCYDHAEAVTWPFKNLVAQSSAHVLLQSQSVLTDGQAQNTQQYIMASRFLLSKLPFTYRYTTFTSSKSWATAVGMRLKTCNMTGVMLQF